MILRTLGIAFTVTGLALGCSSSPVRTGDDGVAVDGYDVVAYHSEDEAIAGSSVHSHEWQGAEWHFASEDNRARFADAPERYAPAYGGWCAWALTEERLAAGDPDYWTVHEGRLYLNCNRAAQQSWEADLESNIERADENWPDLASGG